MNTADMLNDQRDELIARIADLQSEIADLENELDRAMVTLHAVDIQIQHLPQYNTGEMDTEEKR